MATNDLITITISGTTSHQTTLTHSRLAHVLATTVATVDALLAATDWTATCSAKSAHDLLREIGYDTKRMSQQGGAWTVRPARPTSPPNPPPVVTDPAQITSDIRAAAADSTERRARTLIEQGMDENAAVEQAAEEAILLSRRLVEETCQRRTFTEVIDTYGGNIYRLLRDLGDHLGLSLAYVDRATIEAHLERTLSDAEWAAANAEFTALDFDEHVGGHGSFRTDWIETVLEKAGVPGYGYTSDGQDIDEPIRFSLTGGAA